MTSQLEPPNTPSKKSTGRLSKIAGAGTGGFVVVWASWLGLSEKATLAVQAAAPSIAVFISAIGPSVSRLLLNVGRWIGLHFTLKQANRLAKSMPEGSDARKQAEANVEQIHALLNDLIWETTQIFRSKNIN